MAETVKDQRSDCPAGNPQGMIWTCVQRQTLMGLVGALLALLALRYAMNPALVGDPQPQASARWRELADRIDPNTADAPTLAALPGLGPALADRIVAERRRRLAAHPDRPAFLQPQDLLAIKGIGPQILQTIEPYLQFPREDRPASRP